MVVGNDVGVAVLGLVHFQVGMLPCELLAWVNGLREGEVGVSGGHRRPGGGAGGRVQLTSYSWESLRLSLALRRSVCSAMSEMGIGGWLSMPAGRADPAVRAGHGGPARGRGVGVLYSVSLRWTSCG